MVTSERPAEHGNSVGHSQRFTHIATDRIQLKAISITLHARAAKAQESYKASTCYKEGTHSTILIFPDPSSFSSEQWQSVDLISSIFSLPFS